MASAIFLVPFVEGQGPALDMATLTADETVEGYGWSVIGHVPQATTCLVRLWASDATLDTLAESPDYLLVEDVP